MSMNMSPELLETLAERIRVLQDTGVEVQKIALAGHDIYLAPGPNGTLLVSGITNKQQAVSAPAPADNTSGYRRR